MVIYYADDKPQDAWKRLKTWDDTPIMHDSFRPISFILNRPLKRPDTTGRSDAQAQPKPQPMTLPPVKYIPQPKWQHPILRYYDSRILMMDGVPFVEIDGDFIESVYERHSGPQTRFPRAKPVPGLKKPPRGRPVPTKESGERKGMTTYTCRVCQKVFTRSEHRKRHVRSLHMHMEDTYMCSLPVCDKTFARRDNLLQHERKHRLYGAIHDCTKNFAGELFPNFLPHMAEPPMLARGRILPAWMDGIDDVVYEIPADAGKYGGPDKPDLLDEDWLPVGERYRVIREDKHQAEALAAEKEERKDVFERALAPQQAIGTSRNMPLRLKPVFPKDFYYCGIAPS